MEATTRTKMTPAESGVALLASAQAVHAVVMALADGRIDGPASITLKSGYKRFAPHFNRVHGGRNSKPYSLAWLAQVIGSQYPSHKGQPSLWIVAGLQFNVNVERGTWGDAEIAKAERGEHGFTCNALVKLYRKESRARIKYVKRNRNRKKNAKVPVLRKSMGLGRIA